MQDSREILEQMKKDRHYLHENAECGFHTPLTSKYIINSLEKMGYTPRVIGKGGIIAETKNKGAKYTLLRADMDALPMREETDLKFRAKNGNMHACGHDMHSAILLGVARLIKENEEHLKRPVRLYFQPAEEILAGAKDGIENRLLVDVERAFMLHVLPHIGVKSGTVIIPSGGIGAPSAMFYRISLKGIASHGASPSAGRGVLAPMSQICLAFDSILANIASSVQLIHSIGRISCGNSANSIPDSGTLEGTMRSEDESLLGELSRKMEKAAFYIAKGYGVGCHFNVYASCPPLFNNDFLSQNAKKILKENKLFVLTEEDFKQKDNSIGGSEDFAYISKEVPSLMIGLVAGTKPGIPLHNPKIEFDDMAMIDGARALFLLSQE